MCRGRMPLPQILGNRQADVTDGGIPLNGRIRLDTFLCRNKTAPLLWAGLFYFLTGLTGKPGDLCLNIEIQVKLVGMGTQLDVVDFIFGFVLNPHVDRILGENIAL